MLSLVRRDDALRRLPVWAVVLLLNASVVLGLAYFHALRNRSAVSAAALALLGWAIVAIHLVVCSARPRARALNLALPIPARTLWLAHLAATAIGGLVLTGAYWAAVALHASAARGHVTRDASLGGLALLLASASLLASALLELPSPRLVRVPFTVGRALWVGLVVLVPFALLAALAEHGLLGGTVLLAIGAAAIVAGYRRVPPAFSVVPRDPAPAGVARLPETVRGEVGGGRVRRTVWLATCRCLTLGSKELLAQSFIVLIGVFLAGAMDAWSPTGGLRDARFLYVPMGTYMLFTFVAPRLAQLHHVDFLPVSRRLLFAGLILPSAAIFLASFGAGIVAAARSDARTEYVNFEPREKDGPWAVTVPLRVHRISWDGVAPEIGSPWGESHAAETIPLLRGSRAVLWNPFSAPPGSSARFVALQISRAAEALYGAKIPPEEIERRWLETGPDGAVVGRAPALPLRADRPSLVPRSGPVVPMMLALVLAPWLLLVAVLHRTYRASLPDRVRHAAYWGVVVLFILTMVAAVLLMVAGGARPWLARALVEIPAWALARSPVLTAAVWLASALVVLGAYRVAEIQFLRMEIPTRPLRFTLFEHIRQDG